jgi:hypothetical protein
LKKGETYLYFDMSYIILSLLYIVRVIKSGRMRWAGHVAHMWERGGIYRVLVGKPENKGTQA